MRLLVTNTQTPQAYAIIRALRPHAEHVVATIEGDTWRARLLGLQFLDRAVYALRTRVAGRSPIDVTTAPPPLWQQVREFAQTYGTGRRRVWDPYSRHFFHDPVVASLWWLQFSTWLTGAWRQVGR